MPNHMPNTIAPPMRPNNRPMMPAIMIMTQKRHPEVADLSSGFFCSFILFYLPNVSDQPRPAAAVGCSAWLGSFFI